MKDVTYIIHTHIDCQERLNNLDFCIRFLQGNFNTNILIVEEDVVGKVKDRYKNVEYLFLEKISPLFNRARLANAGARMVYTPYMCSLDMDVFLDPEIYQQAVKYLDEYSLVYPFNGMFFDIPQRYNRNKDLRTKDIAIKDMKLLNVDSVGGLQFIRTDDFIKGGMTNEFILGWGFEDNEFNARFTILGYKIKRMDNPIYHFSHPRSFNSDGRSPRIHDNEKEFERVRNMNKEELMEYINRTFYWCK